jgi:ABC-2 type transport system permease protein
MARVMTVAVAEFLALVRTKFFLISILMMPISIGLAIGFQVFAAKHVDRTDRTFAVIDRTGVLYEPLAAAAQAFNEKSGSGDAQRGPHFLSSEIDLGGRSIDDVKVQLSDRVRSKDLFAFVEIPASILDPDRAKAETIDYYTETTSYTTLPDWIQQTLNTEIRQRRFGKAGIDVSLVEKLDRPASVATLGLVTRNADGSIAPAKTIDEITRITPLAYTILMFFAVMWTAQNLLSAVIEEKMSRISEVLVSAVSTFQLLMGKLLGVAFISITLALVYFLGGAYLAFNSGRFELINPMLFVWFIIFLVCAVLMYGSAFLAVGSACTDMKDAQSLIQPAMILIMLPYLASFAVLRAPDTGFAVGMSIFPTAAPFVMMLRMAMPPGPPLWQVGLAIVLTLATTVVCVWAAGRIFRVGLLMQGKTPNLPELLRWIRA